MLDKLPQTSMSRSHGQMKTGRVYHWLFALATSVLLCIGVLCIGVALIGFASAFKDLFVFIVRAVFYGMVFTGNPSRLADVSATLSINLLLFGAVVGAVGIVNLTAPLCPASARCGILVPGKQLLG